MCVQSPVFLNHFVNRGLVAIATAHRMDFCAGKVVFDEAPGTIFTVTGMWTRASIPRLESGQAALEADCLRSTES